MYLVVLSTTERTGELSSNQLIQLKPDYLEAIANHLEQAAFELRNAILKAKAKSIWVNDVQHIETILGSTDSLLRDVQKSLEESTIDRVSAQGRIGRPRRTRRRNP